MSTPPKRPKTPALFEQWEQARIEKVRTDIAVRLKKTCIHLSREEFVSLVDKMTMVQIEGEAGARAGGG